MLGENYESFSGRATLEYMKLNLQSVELIGSRAKNLVDTIIRSTSSHLLQFGVVMFTVILWCKPGFALEESGQLLRAFEAHLTGDLADLIAGIL